MSFVRFIPLFLLYMMSLLKLFLNCFWCAEMSFQFSSVCRNAIYLCIKVLYPAALLVIIITKICSFFGYKILLFANEDNYISSFPILLALIYSSVFALGRILSMKLINVVNWHSFLVLYLKGVFSSLFSPIKDNDCFHFVIDILIRLGKISHILCFLEVLIINSWLKVIFLHLLILFFLL